MSSTMPKIRDVEESNDSDDTQQDADSDDGQLDNDRGGSQPDTDTDTDSDDEHLASLRQLQQELADMPFDQLQAMRNKMGSKKFDALQRDLSTIGEKKSSASTSSTKTTYSSEKETKKKIPGRANKNRPREVTAKRPVSRLRQIVEVKQTQARDPRFDSLSGNFNQDLFEKSYAFLEDYRKAEVEQLTKELKKTKNEERRRELQAVLSRMKQQEKQKKTEKVAAELRRKQRKAEKAAVAEGKKPYYPKKADLKTMERVARFKQIAAQGEGKVKDYITKRRKKNAAKDHRYVPYERR